MFSKILTGFIIFIMVSMVFVGIPGSADAQENPTWTYMVYMSGDSSLASNVPDDIQEMQQVGSGDGLEIIVLVDTAGMDDSRLLRIVSDGLEEIPLTNINSAWGNELEMGSASTLSQFVIWAAENYPADRYILDLWGHGMGWAGICPDKENPLECQELRTALQDVSDAEIDLDIISMDACQMGMMEIAYELGGMADYAVLSEKDVPLDGWPYDHLLNLIKDNSQMTVQEFGSRMVDAYMDWGLGNSHYSLTLSFIDLSQIQRVASSLDAFAIEATLMIDYFNPQFIKARSLTEEYDGNSQYDIRHLLSNIIVQTNCMQLKVLALNISQALDDAIVYERHWTNIQDEPAEHAHGLSIWFPSYSPSPRYLYCSFARDTGWDEFLTGMASYTITEDNQQIVNYMEITGLDSDGNGLKDSILIFYSGNIIGNTHIDIHGPNGNIVNSFQIDTSLAGTLTVELESFGAYSVAVYIKNSTGVLKNYSYFQEGLAKEGVSIISGQVTSDIGRELQWTQISLINSQGIAIASTNTDRTGHYSIEVIVPTDTDGSNLTLVCGLGDIQQNYTIMELADQNTANFQLDTSNDYLGRLIPITAIFIIVGLGCLAIWGIFGRSKSEIIYMENPPQTSTEPEYSLTGTPETESETEQKMY